MSGREPGDHGGEEVEGVRFLGLAQQRRLLGVEEVCDGYRIGVLLGRGGMGEVHEGTQLAENREVVLKSLPAGWMDDAEAGARLAREADLLRRLAHPGIADFVEFKVIGGRPRLVMALVEGLPLLEYLEQALTVEAKVELVAQVARAVVHAHGRDVAHRDLKPGNVMVREDGTAVVLDFGIGALTDAGGLPVAGLTKMGTVAGTPHWMAPEQATGTCLLPKAADVYAMGLLLFKLLTGELPILPRPEEGDLKYLIRVQQERPRRLREVNPCLSKSLEAICEMALQREAEARSSAQTFADDLGRWLRNEPVSARQAGTAERMWLSMRRRPDWWLAGGVALAGLVMVAMLQSRSAARESAARNVAEQALAGSMQTLAASDAAMAAESASRGAYDEALPWLARSLRRDPRNEMAAWLAGQIMGQRQSFALKAARKVPMPQCAMYATENEYPAPVVSATSICVTNDWPKPPNSSGMDIPINPSSPDFFSMLFISSLSLFSTFSRLGYTSASRKSLHVWAIILCSSLNSSGMNISFDSTSLTRNSPLFKSLLFSIVSDNYFY